MRKAFILCVLWLSVLPAAHADEGSITNTGTSANPAGTLTLSGNSLTYFSTDGLTALNATFTTSSSSESCSGGGRGGHITCYTTFTGSFSGTLSVSGVVQAINGSTYQSGVAGGVQSGTTVYNSAYTPFYFSDSEQIHRSDDIYGTNMASCCSQGFYGAYGIALDSSGRIYVADTYNARVVRIDDMNGTNWTAFGTYGSDIGQFNDPQGIAVDSLGRIYVMDTNNARLVRMDDMNGTNWTVFNAAGSGPGQLSTFTSVAVDALNHVYVADTGNHQIVRMDDITGAGWTVLNQSQPVNGATYSFSDPVAVAVGPDFKIYVADNEYYAPAVVRVDDMSGTNWVSLYVSPSGSGGLNSIAIDSTGMVLTGGGGVRLVDNMAGFLSSTNGICPLGCYYVFGVTPLSLPNPRPSAVSFTPPTLSFSTNVGTSSTQSITVANFGGSPLNVFGISANGGFSETDNCTGQLAAGSSCTISVMFTPSATGAVSGALVISDDSGNLGASQSLVLSGTGTAPVASVSPTSLSFSTVLGSTSTAKTVTVTNTGTGPLQISNVALTGPFSQTNTCSGSIAPAASCTISVKFTPSALGSVSGVLTLSDNAGTQTVSLSGNGTNPVSLSSTSLSFGTWAVGNTSTVKTVTVTNRESVQLNFSSIAVSAGFAIASNTCGSSVAAGGSCSVGVTFTPTTSGAFTGTLTFADDALTSLQTVSLGGTGSASVTLSASSLSFGTVVVGTTSSTKTVTVTNRQSIPVNLIGVSASAGFNVASNTCTGALASQASCTVGVTFRPAAITSYTGTLTTTDDAANSPQTVSLTGTGSAPVTFSASSLNFGTVTVGTTSSAKSVTLTNRQSVSLSLSSIVASARFLVSSTTCGSTVAAGATCSVSVKFAPTAKGTVTGSLTFTDGAMTSPQTVTLTGTGQ